MERSERYLRWNDAIAEEFFSPDDAGRPVYLAVDDDELAEIAANVGLERTGSAAVDDFVEVVRAELRRGTHGLFRSFLRNAENWRAERSVPPYIGLLSMCVLAASRMETDPEKRVFGNDYYSRLNDLLRRNVHAGRPENFEQLERLWEDLGQWLDDDLRGARGRSAIQKHPHFVHIGYPMSQCVLRAADRRRLPDFFRSVGLEPRDEISGPRLLVLFRAWARPGCPLTAQGQATVARASGPAEDQLIETLQRELEDWDGELRDERGRRRGEIVLFAEPLAGGRRINLALYARRPDGFPVDGWRTQDRRPVELRAAADGWFGRLGTPVTAEVLKVGVSLVRPGFALTLDPSAVIPCREAFLPAAGWISARQATPVQPHLVLLHKSIEPAVRHFLAAYAEPGWQIVTPSGIPNGWRMAERVRIAAVPKAVPPELARLAPRFNTAMRLEGGLQLRRGVYLSGGEPDLWVTIDRPGGSHVEVDGHITRVDSGIARLSLRERGLPEGQHEIVAAGETRRFSTVVSFGDVVPRRDEEFGFILERHRTYRPTTSVAGPLERERARCEIVICGAHIKADAEDLPVDARKPLVLRSGFASYHVIGSLAGEVASLGPVEKPAWLERLKVNPTPTCQFFEFAPVFDPQWVIYGGRERTLVRPATGSEIVPPRRSRDALARIWATVIRDVPAEADVPPELKSEWARYVAEAEATLASSEEEAAA